MQSKINHLKSAAICFAIITISGCASQGYDENAPIEKQISDLRNQLASESLDNPVGKTATALNYTMLRTKLAQNGQCEEAINSYSNFLEKTVEKGNYFSSMAMTPGNFLINCMNKNPNLVSNRIAYYTFGYSEIFRCAYQNSFNNAQIDVFPKYSTEEKIVSSISALYPSIKNTREQVQQLTKLLTEDCGFVQESYTFYSNGDQSTSAFRSNKFLFDKYSKIEEKARNKGITLFLPIINSVMLGQADEMKSAARILQSNAQVQKDLEETRKTLSLASTARANLLASNINTQSAMTSITNGENTAQNGALFAIAQAAASGDKKAIQLEITKGYVNYVLGESNTAFAEATRQMINSYESGQLGGNSRSQIEKRAVTNMSPQCQQMFNSIKIPTLPANGPAACPAFQAQARFYAQVADVASRCATPAEAADARRAANEAAQAAQQFCGDTSSYPARQSYSPPSTPRPAKPAAPEAKVECQPDLIGSKCPRN